MLKFRLRVIDPGVSEALLGFYNSIDDLTVFFRKWFVPRYLVDVQKNFATEGGMVGGWDPLSAEYKLWKDKHAPGRKINVLTGGLQRSFSPAGRSKFLKIEASKRQAQITNTKPNAFWVQQFRPIMIPSNRLESKVYSRLLNDYLEQQAKRVGFRGGKGSSATPPAASPPSSAFGPSFFDSPSAWTEEHFRRWPEGPGKRKETGRSREEEED